MTQRSRDVFPIHQRSVRRPPALSDQGDDPGDQYFQFLPLSLFPHTSNNPLCQILASAPPEMIPLSGGFPNPQMFPFKQLTLEVSGGDQIVLQGKGLQVKNISIPPTSQTQAALE